MEFTQDHVILVIDNSGYIIPWIKASSIVIQNGCQTGLEAYGLDKPVLTYAPFSRGSFTTMKKTVPGKISLVFFDMMRLHDKFI